MKVKLKLDKQQIVEFLTAHVEKGAFGLFILGFLFFCIGALKHSPYDKVPKDFMDAASRVDTKVTTSAFDPATDIPPVQPLPEAHSVPELVWVTREVWNRPVFDVKKRRPEPKFLAVQDVRVATGYGAIFVRSTEGEAPAGAQAGNAAPPPARPGGGDRAALIRNVGGKAPEANMAARPGANTAVKGKQWAVITGLVPIAAQIKEYRAAFRDVRYASLDLDNPHYESFDIERAEVPPGTSADAELKWVLLDRKQANTEEATFSDLAIDPVDPAFADPLLTKQLPRISGKEHDRSVGHPKIPLGPQTPGGTAAPAAPCAPAAGGGDAIANRMRGNAGRAAVGAGAGNTTQGPQVDYKLFRCFDFSVQPGRTYRYRVRLVLDNPNYNVGAQYLANAALAKGATRPSPWSDPSSEVNIPRGFSMLAGNARPARGLSDQKIDVVLRMWDQKEAVDASRLAELVRGQVANFPAEDVPIDRNNSGAPEMRKISFRTDMMVVDITGGESLSVPGGPRARAPSQVLVLEPNGKLTVKSELADAETYDPTKQRLKEMQDAVKPPPAADKDDDEKDKGKKKKGDQPGLGGLRPPDAAGKGKAK